MKTVRYFLLALTLTACASTQLRAMNEQVPHDQHSLSLPLQTYQLLSTQLPSDLVQLILSIQIHHNPVAFARTLTYEEIESLFNRLQKESLLKMPLRLVSAQDHKTNLDNLECIHFVSNITKLVNYNQQQYAMTLLFSQEYLHYVLPLLEPLIKAPVKKLKFSVDTLCKVAGRKLTDLPDSIDTLVNLEELYILAHQLTKLPESFGKLVNLKTLNMSANQLTMLPESIGNLGNLITLLLADNQLTDLPNSMCELVNLDSLVLFNNQFSDDKKRAIKKLFRNVKKITF